MAGKLDKSLCYLSGAMEFVADHGVEWRRKFLRLSQERNLRIDLIDPTNKPGPEEMKIGEDKETQIKLQQAGEFHELKRYVKSYRRYDLRFVDNADFLVVVVDPRIPQWGTADETYFAESQHKPLFFICDGGLYKLPRWLFDVIDLDDPDKGTRCNVFTSVEAVIDELVMLDSGEIPMSRKWVLYRKYVEANRWYD